MSIGHLIEMVGEYLPDGMLKLEGKVNAPPVVRIMAKCKSRHKGDGQAGSANKK